MLHVAGTSASTLAQFSSAYDVGGLILMGDNMPSPVSGLSQVTAAVSTDSGLPVIIGIDQEGGIVRRVDTDTGASASALRGLPVAAARDTFAKRAALLAELGITVNFGIVADVTADVRSFIYPRVLGTTSAESAARVAQAVEGEHGTVYSTLKHFPGHGAAPGDSHSSIPTTSIGLDEWRRNDAPPFESGITAGAEFVMMGHLRFTAVDPSPATLSARWHEILRDELGFTGVTITDDMAMLQRSGDTRYSDAVGNTIAAIEAGNTMILFVGGAEPGALIAGLVAAVDDGRLQLQTVDAAALKLLMLRREHSGFTGPFVHCFEECEAAIG